MWLANFEDGSAVTSKQTFWTTLAAAKEGEKKLLTAIQLTHPHYPKLFIGLSNLDKYYFVTEAVQLIQSGQEPSAPSVVAEIIGGVDTEFGIVTEIKLDYRGSVRNRIFPFSEYKYSHEILVDGIKRKTK